VVHTTEWGSSDIAAAVQRQGKFVADMARIQWLEPDMEALPLLRGIVRYRVSP